jgi:arginyl-tRNA synthetase
MSVVALMEQEIIDLLKGIGIETIEEKLERPPRSEFGDLAFPCFDLAKEQKKSPQAIAQDILSRLELPKGMVKDAKVVGGYVNFFFDWTKLSTKILKSILTKDEKYGKPAKLKKEKIMVEYSHPNPVHSMHIGHARGTLLGDALANLLEFIGHKVVRANYMNDSGLQVAKLVTAVQMWAKDNKPDKKDDYWLWEYYVKFHDEAKNDESLELKARENLNLIDVKKDKKTVALRDKVVKWCIEGFKKTYEDLGVGFDVYLYESKFRDEGKKIVEKALKKKLAFESEEKTIVADLEKHGLPSFVILRSDGTGLYQTSDLGMTVYKFEHYKLDKSIWAAASAQNLYFKQLFKLLGILGYKWAKDCIHFSFDLVRLPRGKISSREGKAVLLDEVINKLEDMAYKEVDKRSPKGKEGEKRKTARSIGIGALKYAINKVETDKGITFDFKTMLSFDGNTGPYLQYAHTRCASILSKAGKTGKSFKTNELKKVEKELVKALADFPKVIEQSAKEMRINLICNYAYNLANLFSTFYQFCPVLKAEKEQKNFRLGLVTATKIVLRNALSIVGMDAIEKM